MRILDNVGLDFDDVLLVPQRSDFSSRGDERIDITREYKFRHCVRPLKCTGVIVANMYNTGTKEMAYTLAEKNMLTALHKYHDLEDIDRILRDPVLDGKVFITIGESKEDLEFLIKVDNIVRYKSYPLNRLMVCIDVANGYRSCFVEYIKEIRDLTDERTLIMAGNVTTPEMVQELILAGVDIVKIFIGPGSQCLTRRVTGVGYPTFTATVECANAAHGLGGMVCCDGGFKYSGDINKAFGAGADFVMTAGMFAGTDQCEGEWIYSDGHKWKYQEKSAYTREYQYLGVDDNKNKLWITLDKEKDGKWLPAGEPKKKSLKFFGMSSYEAMEKFGGKEKEYRASEGKSELIPYKGDASLVCKEILGGIRSAATYLGCSRLKDFPKVANFIRINK